MTIGVSNRNNATGNGAVDSYPYGFKIFAATDLHVIVRDLDDVETLLTYPTHYSVDGVGLAVGGNVVLVGSGNPWQDGDGDLLTGWEIAILRVRPLSQAIDIRNAGGIPLANIEDGFDNAMMVAQQLQDQLDRTMRFGESFDPADFDATLPAPLAGAAIGFNATGDGLTTLLDVEGVPVSAAAATVLDDLTTDAMLVTLGGIPKSIVDAKGDLLLGSADNNIVRKGSPADGGIMIARAVDTGGWTFAPLRLPSYAPNPFFQIDQRVNSATSRADDTYCLDRWYVLTQSNPITVTQQSDQEAGQPSNIRLTQSNATPQRMGLACIIEGNDIKAMRSKVMTLAARVRTSSGQNVRFAALEWTGTLDTVTSDVVNDWTSADYTDGAGKFFVDANLTPVATTFNATVAATWQDTDSLLLGLGASFNNLILIFWTEGTAAQNVTLDIGEVRLMEGIYMPAHGGIIVPKFSEEYMRSLRYYAKSFRYPLAPASNTGAVYADGPYITCALRAGANVQNGPMLPFVTPMRVTPSITTFNPGAAGVQALDFAGLLDCSALGILVSDKEIGFEFTGNAGTAIGNKIGVHWTASAEL